ncbi:hypothetical protein TI39_contig4298g00001 [Zymoseptoria brevis]|uniref:Uncharacterized protein n=1 Tax=Zymoseptoria brevis TaxID=1047168 RepID=A0A0F4G960_9PEZI|nr:hypothetical protein TI39_contig4298g00001 [Zymoseptoria brevis]
MALVWCGGPQLGAPRGGGGYAEQKSDSAHSSNLQAHNGDGLLLDVVVDDVKMVMRSAQHDRGLPCDGTLVLLKTNHPESSKPLAPKQQQPYTKEITNEIYTAVQCSAPWTTGKAA